MRPAFGLALAAFLSLPPGAWAIDPPAEDAVDQLQEVVVTAQKRSEDVQQVPVAVTAITPKTAANFGALRTDELTSLVPGVEIQHNIDSINTFIRGVGPNSDSTGEESSVAVYLDDLYIEQGDASVFSLNSISGIELLKGPQGTLFGRNATGGVIQVRTPDPSFGPSLDAHIGYGNYDTKSGDLYATGSLIPGVLAANVALYDNAETAGWGHDVLTGARAFTSHEWNARVKFLITPTPTTRVLLSLNHIYTRSEEGLGFNQVPGYIAAGAPLLASNARFVGWYNTEDYINDVSAIKHDLVELRVDQETELAKVVEIAGWQRMHGNAQFAQDASPEALVATQLYQGGRDWSNEIQILNPDSASYGSWLRWIAGAYYLHDDSGYPGAVLRGADEGFPVTSPGDQALILNDNVDTTSVAGFAQATAQILPHADLTFGARYTRDDRTFTGGIYFSPGVPGVGGLPACVAAPVACPTAAGDPGAKRGWSMMTYRTSLDYHFTENVMAYVSYNRGAKSGEFDTFGTAAAGPIARPPVNPEVLDAYELGLKSEWDERHVRIDAAAFHYDISNLQFATIVPGGTELINAAGATIDGGEVDATVAVIPRLTVNAALSAQFGHYTSFAKAPAYFNPPAFVINAAGNPITHLPNFTASVSIDYTIPTAFGNLTLNTNVTHTAPFEFFPDESLKQAATNIVNASVLWTAPSTTYDLRVWGLNITNERYYSFGSESLGLGKQFSPAPPATFGLTLGLHL